MMAVMKSIIVFTLVGVCLSANQRGSRPFLFPGKPVQEISSFKRSIEFSNSGSVNTNPHKNNLKINSQPETFSLANPHARNNIPGANIPQHPQEAQAKPVKDSDKAHSVEQTSLKREISNNIAQNTTDSEVPAIVENAGDENVYSSIVNDTSPSNNNEVESSKSSSESSSKSSSESSSESSSKSSSKSFSEESKHVNSKHVPQHQESKSSSESNELLAESKNLLQFVKPNPNFQPLRKNYFSQQIRSFRKNNSVINGARGKKQYRRLNSR
ncbi:Hypothetical predicted protein [Pelobates cultripes]|uniref:Uncharacterized protein n=1 Tax=Pelobates cultripes TaxID=61616 RepID=A0AAD1WZ58_PELCU|nr:Hypothetical predicted protein [Pelobates cultripes]